MRSIVDKWFQAATEPRDGAPEPYKPYLGWSNLAQPEEGLDGKSYLELSHYGVDPLKRRMIDFCERNNLSHVVIPQDAYRTGFEKGNTPFRAWLEEYCHLHGMNPQVQVAIVGPCVKDEASSLFKGKARPAERTKDYLRGMYIFLQGPTARTARASLDNLGSAIDSLQAEDRFQTLARKNYLHTPKANGYRAYKGAWNVPLEGPFSGWEMMAEVKLEHQSQQDVNRMTRRFMEISRATREALERFYDNCTSEEDEKQGFSKAHSHVNRLQARINTLDGFSKLLYDYVHDKSGMNRFLGKEAAKKHEPADYGAIQAAANKAIEMFGPSIIREIGNAGLDITNEQKFRRKLEKVYG